jgi:hypothetical protein
MNLKIKKFPAFIFLIALSFFISCNLATDPGDQEDAQPEPIEGKILFKVHEAHKEYDCNCEPSIVLSMATEIWYPYCSNSIVNEIIQTGNTIDVKVSGIYEPPLGLPAFGPATARKFLNLAEGRYYLNFIYRWMMDRYEVFVKKSSIEVTGFVSLFTKFTEPEFEVFWRYPRNSFVYLCGTMTETSWIGDDFLSVLLSEVNLEEFKFPDYGEICYPRSSQGHYYDMPARYFIYKSEEDFDKAGEILKSYNESVISSYSGVGISLTNWKNKYFYSWLFASR